MPLNSLQKMVFWWKNRQKFIPRNQRGSAILYVLGLVPIIMFLSYSGLNAVKSSYEKLDGVTMDRGALQAIANQVKAIVENQGGWTATVFAPENTTLECLRSNGQVCPISTLLEREFRLLIDSTRTLLQPEALPNGRFRGFTPLGLSCDTYHPTNPDPQCVYRVRVFWNPQCVLPCISTRTGTEPTARLPVQEIDMQFFFSSPNDDIPGEIEIEIANSVLTRGQEARSLEVFCNSLAAQVSGGGTACRMALTPRNCRTSSGQHMVDRVDSNGNVICRNPTAIGSGINQMCTGGNAMVGFTGDSFVCDVF